MKNTMLKEESFLNIEDKEKHLQKIKFCIISSYKSQMCKDRLTMFTIDNK